MTNKEALEALLNGEKITTTHWLKNSNITKGDKADEPKYIYFDFDKDKIVDENKKPVCFDTSSEALVYEYKIYNEPLFTKAEKKFIREIGKAIDFPYMDIRLTVTECSLLINVGNRCCFGWSLNDLVYEFKGLERHKNYTWEELGVWGDDD